MRTLPKLAVAACVALASIVSAKAAPLALSQPAATNAERLVVPVSGSHRYGSRAKNRYFKGYRGYRYARKGYRKHRGYYYPRAAFSFQLRIAPRVHKPRYRAVNRHVAWCANRYRTYRVSDNTYIPRVGHRAYCRSPYRR